MGIRINFPTILTQEGWFANWRSIPDKVQVADDGVERIEDRGEQPKEVDSKAHVSLTFKGLGESLFVQPSLGQVKHLGTACSYLELHWCTPDTADKIDHPQNGAMVERAVTCVVNGFPLLQQLVPASLKGFKLEALTETNAHLQILRQGRSVISRFLFRIDNAIALCESRIVDMLKPVYALSQSAVRHNAALSSELDGLVLLFTENADKAAETRKDHAAVASHAREVGRAEGRAEAMAEIQRQSPGAAPPAPPTPATPTTGRGGIVKK